jgi:hypothetical protein
MLKISSGFLERLFMPASLEKSHFLICVIEQQA